MSQSELTNAIMKLVALIGGRKKPRIWIFATEPDEPIPTEGTIMKLSKPIKPGFRRPFTITPDEPVDKDSDGTFYRVENLQGDSTVTVDPASNATSLKGWLNGDGATGEKSAQITADGHLGDGELPVTLTIDYTVASPDATSLDNFVEGVDEPIPAE